MALPFSDNFQNNSNKPESNKYGPYTTLNEAFTSPFIKLEYRSPGLTIGIRPTVNDPVVDYWWPGPDFSNAGLIRKMNTVTQGGEVIRQRLNKEYFTGSYTAKYNLHEKAFDVISVQLLKSGQVPESAISRGIGSIGISTYELGSNGIELGVAPDDATVPDGVFVCYYPLQGVGGYLSGAQPYFKYRLTPKAPGNNVDSLNWSTLTSSTLNLCYNAEPRPVASTPYTPMGFYLGDVNSRVGTLNFAQSDEGNSCAIEDTDAAKFYYKMQVINENGTLGPIQDMKFFPGKVLISE